MRRLCVCAEEGPVPAAELAFIKAKTGGAARALKLPKGCPRCGRSGFKGRIPIAEAFLADETMTSLIAEDAPQSKLRSRLRVASFISMIEDGIAKVNVGGTTLSEVMAALDG